MPSCTWFTWWPIIIKSSFNVIPTKQKIPMPPSTQSVSRSNVLWPQLRIHPSMNCPGLAPISCLPLHLPLRQCQSIIQWMKMKPFQGPFTPLCRHYQQNSWSVVEQTAIWICHECRDKQINTIVLIIISSLLYQVDLLIKWRYWFYLIRGQTGMEENGSCLVVWGDGEHVDNQW